MTVTCGAMTEVDRIASTIEIAGRRFPAAALICPPLSDDPDDTERERGLGAGGGDRSVYVPAENGVLFEVEEQHNDWNHGLSLWLYARNL